MADPYNHPFPQKHDTMYMATIESSHSRFGSSRGSSFQHHDIPGAQPKRQIPERVNKSTFVNSSYIEPSPESHLMGGKLLHPKGITTRDIEGAWPACVEFKSSRRTNPLQPRYKLPEVTPVDVAPPRNFLRNTLDVSDIVRKRNSMFEKTTRASPQPIEGSQPGKHFRRVEATERLKVKDINKDGVFRSGRLDRPSDPLNPSYVWRDTGSGVNQYYGDIGNRPQIQAPDKNKQDFILHTKDIEGAKANSYNERRHLLAVRKDYKKTNDTSDIGGSHASSLRKGIASGRSVNPLMPDYQLPSF